MEKYVQSSVFVLILKAPNEDAALQDPYIEHLQKVNIPSKFIPTLQFRFKNLDEISECLNNPKNYAGIVFNSPRCVRAVIESLKNEPLKHEWKSKKFFVVGEATGKLAKSELDLNYEGQSSGNLAALLQDISQYDFEKPLLMPVSNLHSNHETNVKLQKIVVYETYEHEQLEFLLRNAIQPELTNILVFFSPSGVKSTFRHMPLSSVGKFLFVAIGPTTAEEMKRKSIEVHGVCRKPNPASLIELISELCATYNPINNETIPRGKILS